MGAIKEQIEQLRHDAERAELMADFARAAELRYGRLTELERQLAEEEQRLHQRQGGRPLLKEEVDEEDIAEVVASWTGIPVSRMLEGEMHKLLRMEQGLHQRVVGQDDAITAVANAVRRGRAGLSDPNRPIGSFIFLGPTGVGKTELARALAEFLFDDERAMIRLDMSEYMEKHTVARLIGAPPGYIGYDEGGQLTEAVRRRPYAVLLLDEIEKAHPDVFNVLLQLLDDGRLTDGQGRVVDFRNTLVIMTSNLGSHLIAGLAEDADEATLARMRRSVLDEVRNHFRPEFLNRVDELILFSRLDRSQLREIVGIQLRSLRDRLAARKLQLDVTDAAVDLLASEGYDPVYGARPLKRLIQRRLQDPIAMAILEGRFREGDTVSVDAEGENFVIGGGGAAAGVDEVVDAEVVGS
jgi:ATP-dependent Clp protease ATP-binding subunit ClpB